jgi:hypothetical protein
LEPGLDDSPIPSILDRLNVYQMPNGRAEMAREVEKSRTKSKIVVRPDIGIGRGKLEMRFVPQGAGVPSYGRRTQGRPYLH